MKLVDRSDILPLGEYESVRDRFRLRVVAEKKARRFLIGDRVSGVFENRDTVLMQIQEMLRTERITRESSIQHEIDTYNELVPGERELSATMMIEIDDKEERDSFLVRARGIERAMRVVVGDEVSASIVNPTRELEDRASAVIYVKFPLSERAAKAIADNAGPVRIEIAHPAYEASTELPRSLIASLASDF